MEQERQNKDIIREIWQEEVAVSKMKDLREAFSKGLNISFQSVWLRVNGTNPSNDFEFLMMVEILGRVVNLEKWKGYINEKKRQYGMYDVVEF